MQLLKDFRDGTFHFQPTFKAERHKNYIAKNGFASALDLYERQDFVVRKMVRYMKHNANFTTLVL